MLIYWAAEARSLVASSFPSPFFILVFPSVWKRNDTLVNPALMRVFTPMPHKPYINNRQSLLAEFCDKLYIYFVTEVMTLKKVEKVSGHTSCSQVSAEVAQPLEAAAVGMLSDSLY